MESYYAVEPPEDQQRRFMNSVKPSEAVAVLDHFIETGEIDWARVIGFELKPEHNRSKLPQ